MHPILCKTIVNGLARRAVRESRVLILLGAIGFFFLGLVHLLALRDLPGLHFDEAWIGRYAQELVANPSLTKQQSAYAVPWVARGLAWIYATTDLQGILGLRALQMFFVFSGLLAICLTLWQMGERALIAFLPWTILAFPGLTINHRFAIELTGLHVFCLGLVMLGLVSIWQGNRPARGRAYFLFGALLGVSSHILFLAPLLAAFFIFWREQREPWRLADRRVVQALCLALLPFFLAIFLGVPEKIKAFALIMILLAVMLVISKPIAIRERVWAIWLRLPELVRKYGLYVLVTPFLFNALVFSDGHWGSMLSHGHIVFSGFGGVSVALLVAVVVKVTRRRALTQNERAIRDWMALTIFLLGVMMLKPAPRYFEIALLQLAILAAWALSRLELPKALVGAMAAGTLGMTVLTLNYFSPALQGTSVERETHWLWFRDSSRDFLSKQGLVRWLADHGCGRELVMSPGDSRVDLALDFLSVADWRPSAERNCSLGSMEVWRRRDPNRPGFDNPPALTFADFAILPREVKESSEAK